jgi:hypothetical protein
MRTITTLILVAGTILICRLPETAAQEPPRLRVLRQGDLVWIRSAFSPAQDLIVLVGKGDNRQVITLPAEFAGRKIRILEKTATLTLHTDQTVPPGGLVVRTTGTHASLVVALK